jgi:hypothetical protein
VRCVSPYGSVPRLRSRPASLNDLRRGVEHPPDETRIMVRWWWFGPAVTKPELKKEMRLMKQGGIGGFEVQPTYPLELDNPAKGFRNLPYMSPEFLDMLRFTGEKAKELGLRMDLTLGSGWPFGGPHIPIELASPRLRVATGPEVVLRGGEGIIAVFQQGKAVTRPDPLPEYKELIAKYGDRFQPQDMQLVQSLPSGIMGTIKLVSR